MRDEESLLGEKKRSPYGSTDAKSSIRMSSVVTDTSADPALDQEPVKKRVGDFRLTVTMVNEVIVLLQMNICKHQLASDFFKSRHFIFSTLPQALLTLFASFLSFMDSNQLFLNSRFNLTTNQLGGICSCVVVFLQTMNGIANYGSRFKMHEAAVIDMGDMKEELEIMREKLKSRDESRKERLKKLSEPKSAGSIAIAEAEEKSAHQEDYKSETIETNDFSDIECRFQQSLAGCKSSLPMYIGHAFEGIESLCYATMSRGNYDRLKSVYGTESDFLVYFNMFVYNTLVDCIVSSLWFPLWLPYPNSVKKKTMRAVQHDVMTYSKLFEEKDVNTGCCCVPSAHSKQTNATKTYGELSGDQGSGANQSSGAT